MRRGRNREVGDARMETFDDVFDALFDDDPERAAILRAQSNMEIAQHRGRNAFLQRDAESGNNRLSELVDDNYWLIRYEVACETITHLMALYVEAIEGERKRPTINATRIASFELECRRLAAERRALSSQDRSAIEDLIEFYAPVVRTKLGTVRSADNAKL